MTIPELALLQDQPYSERRRCGRKAIRGDGGKKFIELSFKNYRLQHEASCGCAAQFASKLGYPRLLS
ncbi:MAG: hypothetical protein COA78_09525 [Blastopirellula sp.]|nr:MAG: hypothetical protein COA78_09525 [Blastopirellula sp.]